MLTEGQVYFVTVFTQALLYGIYLATLISCFRWLVFTDEGWKPRQKINMVMTFATIFIFLMSTVNLVTALKYGLNEYINEDGSYKPEYGTVIAMDISSMLAVISVDSVLIYRCWIVYSKSWLVVCVPITFSLASLACSALFLYTSGLNYKGKAFSTEMAQIGKKALIGLYICNIAITVYTTTAIIYRISSARKNSGGSPKRLNYVVRILAESGILYTSTIIFRLVGLLLIAGDDFTWVKAIIASVSDIIGFSMAGITFNLILIRVYNSRVESRDSLATSEDVYGERTMSGTQFDTQPTASLSEGPSSDALDEAKDEIEEHRRSRDEMDEN
ncbi:hypothetical protein JOM56_005305 [Amanita muscaria]